MIVNYERNKRLLARLVPNRLKRWFQETLFSASHLKWRLASGITIEVKSPTDWSLLNDIFVDGEYDEPIRSLLARVQSKQPVTVIDLGANVGFFELRLFQQFHRAQLSPQHLSVYAFEPDAQNIDEFRRRTAAAGAWHNSVTLVQGLVGAQRDGNATYWKSHQHHSCTALSGRRYAGSWSVTVPYVDVETVVNSTSEVDLLKCDIEGSELDFVTAYPGLLRRVVTVVMEIHDTKDVQPIRSAMSAAGLSYGRLAEDHGSNAVWIFSRNSLSSNPAETPIATDNEGLTPSGKLH